jgi:hypothetical protein
MFFPPVMLLLWVLLVFSDFDEVVCDSCDEGTVLAWRAVQPTVS